MMMSRYTGVAGPVAELAYAADLKSAGETLAGSSPARPIEKPLLRCRGFVD